MAGLYLEVLICIFLVCFFPSLLTHLNTWGLFFFHSVLLKHELSTHIRSSKKDYKIKRRKVLEKEPDRKIFMFAELVFPPQKLGKIINWGRKEKGRGTTSERNEESSKFKEVIGEIGKDFLHTYWLPKN